MSVRILIKVDFVQLLFHKTWDIHNLKGWHLDKMLELEGNLRYNRIRMRQNCIT